MILMFQVPKFEISSPGQVCVIAYMSFSFSQKSYRI